MTFEIDEQATETAVREFALPECLHVPVAAVDDKAISAFIGNIVRNLGRGLPSKAYLIKAKTPPSIDHRLPIWKDSASEIFHRQMQVWVHIDYTRYRSAYRKAFPNENIDGKVLSHALNRRVAAIKGFQYVRLTPTSRGANSSSSYTENWSVKHNSVPERMQRQAQEGAQIQYADLADLLLMMDMKIGGGFQEVMNVGQTLVRIPKGS